MLTTHRHLAPRLRKSRAIPLLPVYIITAWTETTSPLFYKHQHKSSFPKYYRKPQEPIPCWDLNLEPPSALPLMLGTRWHLRQTSWNVTMRADSDAQRACLLFQNKTDIYRCDDGDDDVMCGRWNSEIMLPSRLPHSSQGCTDWPSCVELKRHYALLVSQKSIRRHPNVYIISLQTVSISGVIYT